MSVRVAVALLALGSASGAGASEAAFCDALRIIERDIRQDFADDGRASVYPPSDALDLLVGTEVTGFAADYCGSPTFEVLETHGLQTYSWDVMAMGLQFSIKDGLVTEAAVRSKP
ncbi:hypothetical protein [Devosia ginsengisoli]|uniref:Uncharacterized protein n=1 Tax=Devosia ginsengisoli TaxID=400770 RepID=A0A5B8LR66_9HYPH|nr:hypothetical protein [Devosia ginsengisoli]QDZ10194.1 hypothetical protein FPZ08_05195 [Devosia ginsengisoli]